MAAARAALICPLATAPVMGTTVNQRAAMVVASPNFVVALANNFATIPKMGASLSGFGDRPLTFLGLIGRNPTINYVLKNLVRILDVDVRRLLALVSHGKRGIARAFELGAPQGALGRKR